MPSRIYCVHTLRLTTLLTAALLAVTSVFATPSGLAPTCMADELVWYDSLESALEQSHTTGKPILTIFTGSDWCPHCKTLEANVLKSSSFRDWAEANVVLLEIDMPQVGISREVRVARSRVCHTYGIRSFPSVVLIDQEGTAVFKDSGYTGQSAPLWIDMVAKHLPERPNAVAGKPPVQSTYR